MKTCYKFNDYISSFELLLLQVNPINISDEIYCRKYLNHLLQHKRYYLNIYASVFDNLLSNTNLKKEEITLIDFGAGNGLLGLFAKYCGFRKVIINDVDKSFIEAAKNLSAQLEIPIHAFICGDIPELNSYCVNDKPDAIIGTDVIEHIYNLQDFFSNIRQINPDIVSVFTTSANPENYFKVRQLKRLQLKDEFLGGTPDDFDLFGSEAHESFFKMRKSIIINIAPALNEDVVEKLTTATRGLNKTDIIKFVKIFQSENIFPEAISHNTNTCNPLTGSWTERILSIVEYQNIYTANNFSLIVYQGYYNEFKKGLKKILFMLLNKFTSIFGIRFAPFIILVGKKCK